MNENQAAGDASGHQPVMLDEVMDLLDPQPGQTVLDCTVGRAGHAQAIAERLGPDGRLIGLDVDRTNVAFAEQQLADAPCRTNIVHANFGDAREVLDELGVDRVDGVLADLGFASNQMDDPSRGLSFAEDGPLDMRLDGSGTTTAADLLARWSADQIAEALWEYGEERYGRQIARKIVESRDRMPISTTRRLADVCVSVYAAKTQGRRWRIHPATRTFQAIRIVVNEEMDRLDSLLDQLVDLLGTGGRAAIISFHSLEDRRVKQAYRAAKQAGWAELLTRKPLIAGPTEVGQNPRSRSAKLRAMRRIVEPEPGTE